MTPAKSVLLALGAIVLIFAIGIGWWAFRVTTAEVRGQGNAVIQRENSTNRIAAQERFESLWAEAIAADKKIDVLTDAVADDPSYVNKTNLIGARNYCLSVVADYDAEARKYTAENFRAIDLPAQIDDRDPKTDCKETSR